MKVAKIMAEILRQVPQTVKVEIDREDNEDTTSYILYSGIAHFITQSQADELLEFLFSEYSTEIPSHHDVEVHTFHN